MRLNRWHLWLGLLLLAGLTYALGRALEPAPPPSRAEGNFSFLTV